MAVLGKLLFHSSDRVTLSDVLRHQGEQLRDDVDALPESLFSTRSDEEIAAQVAQKRALVPITVDLAAVVANVSEIQIQVADQFGFDRGTVQVAGLRATKSIPFAGNADLWRRCPSRHNLNPPRGEVREGKLIVGMEVTAQQSDEAVRYMADAIAGVREYLEWQEAEIVEGNGSLPSQALQWVRNRRQRLSSASDLLKKLGG